jgi:hypothetical protein
MHNVHLQSPTNQLLQLITSISSSCNLQLTNDWPYNCIQAWIVKNSINYSWFCNKLQTRVVLLNSQGEKGCVNFGMGLSRMSWLLQSMRWMSIKGHQKESTVLRPILQLEVPHMIPHWSKQSLFLLQMRYSWQKLHYLRRGRNPNKSWKIKRPHPNVLQSCQGQ